MEHTSLTNNLRISRSGCLHHSGLNRHPRSSRVHHLLILLFHFSGPKRYDYIEGEDKWVYSRDGRTLHSLLSDELSTAFGRHIEVPWVWWNWLRLYVNVVGSFSSCFVLLGWKPVLQGVCEIVDTYMELTYFQCRSVTWKLCNFSYSMSVKSWQNKYDRSRASLVLPK